MRYNVLLNHENKMLTDEVRNGKGDCTQENMVSSSLKPFCLHVNPNFHKSHSLG